MVKKKFWLKVLIASIMNFILVGSGLILYGKLWIGISYLVTFILLGIFQEEIGIVWHIIVYITSFIHLYWFVRKSERGKEFNSLLPSIALFRRYQVRIGLVLLLFFSLLLIFSTVGERISLRNDLLDWLFTKSWTPMGFEKETITYSCLKRDQEQSYLQELRLAEEEWIKSLKTGSATVEEFSKNTERKRDIERKFYDQHGTKQISLFIFGLSLYQHEVGQFKNNSDCKVGIL